MVSVVTPKISLCTEIVTLEMSFVMLEITHETIQGPIYKLFCLVILFHCLFVVESFFLLLKLSLN